MKRFGLTTVLLCAFLSFADAKTDVKDLFVNMPDSMVSYLDKNKRQEMIDYAAINKGAGVVNLLEGNSVVDSLSNDYLSVALTSSSDMQMMVLPVKGDTVVCVVKTFKVNDGLKNIIGENNTYKINEAFKKNGIEIPYNYLNVLVVTRS